MSELRKANTDHPYFLTFTVVGWIDVFTRSRYSDVIMESLSFCQQQKGLQVYAYVIMPSHVHLVARSTDGKLNNIIRDFKSFTAKKILELISDKQRESRREWLLDQFSQAAGQTKQNKVHQFWQKTNHATELSNPVVFDQKVDYVHNNPVAAGLVMDAESWVYSSASEMKMIDVDVY